MKMILSLFLLMAAALAQTPVRYRINAVAGTTVIGDGGLATDAILDEVGTVYADQRGGFYLSGLFRLRYVNADGVIRTVMGKGYGDPPVDGVAAVESTLNTASDVISGPDGDLYVSDEVSCVVFRIDRAGMVRFVAGTGVCGFSGDRGPARQAQLNTPVGLAFDTQGRLLIADQVNDRIRRVGADGTIETIAGIGGPQTFSQPGLPALQTPVSFPTSLAVAPDGTIYFSEFGYRRVRRITPAGIVANVAGSGFPGNSGDGGPALEARFNFADRIALDSARQRLYISDSISSRVRAVDLASGRINAVAGVTFTVGGIDVIADAFWGDGGPANLAGLARPRGIAVDEAGALYIADGRNFRIRKIENSVIRTVAGRFRNTANGPASRAEMNNVLSIAPDVDGTLVISDRSNRILRRVTGEQIAVIAGTPPERWPANVPNGSSGDGGPALNARFVAPRGTAIDAAGRIYVIDHGSLTDTPRLRKLDIGLVTFLANLPVGATTIAIDRSRNLIYATIPSANKVIVAELVQGALTFRDFAGTGVAGFSGDGGAASIARLHQPTDIAVDAAGNVYIADIGNYRVRRVAGGAISTIMGNGNRVVASSVRADASPLQEAISPLALTVDPANRVTIVEGYGGVVRQLDPSTGRLRVIAGAIGRIGSGGDGGLATNAGFVYLSRIRSDGQGNLYLSDGITDHLRVLRPITLNRLEAVSGNAQSAPASTRLASPLVVRLTASDGVLAGVSVRFSAAGATVNPATAITGADGLARAEVTLGGSLGPVTITATAEDLPPVTFQATATAPVAVNPNRPVVQNAGVATAGAFGAGRTISPGTWIEIYGSNLAAATREWAGSDFVGRQAPTALDGVSVSIGNQAAFVALISPNQINAQVPAGIGMGPVPLTVKTPNGVSEPVLVNAAEASPGLLSPPVFLVDGVQYVAAYHQDQAFVGREGLIPGANFRPARPGDVLTIYGVGFGATSPASPPGVVVTGTPTLPNFTIRLGGASANVLFAGLASSVVGLYQFNFVVPADAPEGDVLITLPGVTQRLMLTVAR